MSMHAWMDSAGRALGRGWVAAALVGALPLVGAVSPVLAKSMAVRPEVKPRSETLSLFLRGQKVGTIHTADKMRPDGRVQLLRESHMRLARGAQVLEMDTTTTVTLDASLRTGTFRYEKRDATGLVVHKGTSMPDGSWTVTLHQGGTTQTQVLRAQSGAPPLMLASAFDTWLRQNLRDGVRLERTLVVEEMGATALAKATVKRTASGYEIVTDMAGLVTTERVDAQARTIEATTPAIAAVARPVTTGDDQAARMDVMGASTWKAPPVPQSARRVVFTVTTKPGVSLSLPEDARQRVLRRAGNTVTIAVSAGPSERGALSPAARKAALAATAYEPVGDPRLVAVVDAVAPSGSPQSRTTALTKWVYGHVDNKGLDRAYAPALATLESKSGDCTEHAVLLSALLRTAGIPTRIVDGVVVSQGVIGYHEWVEAYIDGTGWVAADAAFGAAPAGPTRLKFVQSDTSPAGMLKLGLAAARILGGVDIAVVSHD